MSDVDKMAKLIGHYKRGLLNFSELCVEVSMVSPELADIVEFFMVEYSDRVKGQSNV